MASDWTLKLHGIASSGRGKIVTFCGKIGWETPWPGEFDTVDNTRFETAPLNDVRTVTCKTCLKAIANGAGCRDR